MQHIAASLNSFSPSLAFTQLHVKDDLDHSHHAKHVHTVFIFNKKSFPHTCSASQPPL
jgi:hypothetical protein